MTYYLLQEQPVEAARLKRTVASISGVVQCTIFFSYEFDILPFTQTIEY
jgi:hypothetical protein